MSHVASSEPVDKAVAAAACLNCGGSLGGTSDSRPRFCPACGQETTLRPPTMGEFVQQFGGAYLATEGALWRSLRLLLLRPGALTLEYLAGRRKHYVLPLRLYLTISLVVLLLVRIAGGGTVELNAVRPPPRPNAPGDITLDIGVRPDGLGAGVFFCEGLPGWMCRRLQRRIDVEPARVQAEIESFKDRFLGNLGSAMFVLLPGFALWLKLAYLNRRLRYTEHLVFALHVHAFWFVALLLTLPGWWPLTALAALSVPVYTLLAMKRVYGGRLWPRLLRAGVVTALYGTTLLLALAAVALITLLS
jgi:hypothetical protein